jgi:hypothetical protein
MLRMLRARKFDVDAAATLTQEILAYRAEHGLDGLLQVFVFLSAPLSAPVATFVLAEHGIRVPHPRHAIRAACLPDCCGGG